MKPSLQPSTTGGRSRAAGAGAGLKLALIVAAVVVAWFALSEVATESWFAIHEAKLAKNRTIPDGPALLKRIEDYATASGAQVSERDIGSAAMEMLKCSYGRMAIWSGPEGSMAATILRWDGSSMVSGVESMHNPSKCLGAAGWEIGARTDFGIEDYCGVSGDVTGWDVSRPGVKMRAFIAVFRRFAEDKKPKANSFWNSNRLEPVLTGRRDAPRLIVLGYVPAEASVDEAHATFQSILHAALCGK